MPNEPLCSIEPTGQWEAQPQGNLRQGPTPAVTVGQAGQVNVASQQVNAVGTD